jgi:hypothetical protein
MSINKFFLAGLFSCFLAGIVLLAIKKELIILNFSQLNNKNKIEPVLFFKKKAIIWYTKNDCWHSEDTDLLWSQDQAQNINNLIQNWLCLLEEEKIINQKISLQSSMISQTGQIIYLSFDHNFLNKDLSSYQKLLIIESLLKTLRANQMTQTLVQFLVQHQMMRDNHLDFSNPWPLNGFLNL